MTPEEEENDVNSRLRLGKQLQSSAETHDDENERRKNVEEVEMCVMRCIVDPCLHSIHAHHHQHSILLFFDENENEDRKQKRHSERISSFLSTTLMLAFTLMRHEDHVCGTHKICPTMALIGILMAEFTCTGMARIPAVIMDPELIVPTEYWWQQWLIHSSKVETTVVAATHLFHWQSFPNQSSASNLRWAK